MNFPPPVSVLQLQWDQSAQHGVWHRPPLEGGKSHHRCGPTYCTYFSDVLLLNLAVVWIWININPPWLPDLRANSSHMTSQFPHQTSAVLDLSEHMIPWNANCVNTTMQMSSSSKTYKPDMIKHFRWWAFSANSSIKEDEPKSTVIAGLGTKRCPWCFIIHNVMQCWCKDCTTFPSNAPRPHGTAFHVQLSGGESVHEVLPLYHALTGAYYDAQLHNLALLRL